MFTDYHTISAAALIAVLSGGAVEAMPLSHFPSTYPDTWTVKGKSVFPNFIIGGTDAKKGQYKFYAAYESSVGRQFCGASLVNELWALTAAHCTGGRNQVRVSAYTFTYEPKTEEVRTLTQEVNHPEYNPTTFERDIAMLTWANAIDKVQPVPLFNADTFKKQASPLTVVGLGNTVTSGPFKPPSVLQQVVVDFVTDADCAKAYGSNFKADSMLCATAPGKDSCQGDSGGPIFFTDNNVEKQVGVVSWGYGCAMKGYPGVYASVNENVLGFIEREIDQRRIEQLKKAIQ